MGTMTILTDTLALSGAGNGERTKQLAGALVALNGNLTLQEVVTDTSDKYEANYAWSKMPGVIVRVRNTASNSANLVLDVQSPTGMLNWDVDSNIINATRTVTLESVSGTDWDVIGVRTGSDVCKLSFAKFTDYFSGTSHLISFPVASELNGTLTGSPIIMANGTSVTLSATYAGMRPIYNGIITANPLQIYYNDGSFPISGFVGGTDNLYVVYNGATAMSIGAGVEVTIGGHRFVGCGGSSGYVVKLD